MVYGQRIDNLTLIEASCIWLFFLQALRVIFSVLFGIIYDQVLTGPMSAWLIISVMLVVFAFILPLLSSRRPSSKTIMLFAAVTVISRVGLSINDPQVRYWSALLVLGAGGLYISSLLALMKRHLLTSLILALAIDQVFRVSGQTFDVTLREYWIPIQVIWAVVLLVIIIWLRSHRPTPRSIIGSSGMIWGLSIGAILFLETSLFTLPNAVARWTNFSYELIAPLLLLVTLLPLFAQVRRGIIRLIYGRMGVRLLLFGLLVIFLMVGYFIAGFIPAVLLIAGHFLLLIFMIYLFESIMNQRSKAGVGMVTGMLFFLVLNFLNAFAFTYPYTLPFMRGMGWVVYLVALAGIGLMLSLQASPGGTTRTPTGQTIWIGVLVIVLVIITVISIWPSPVIPFPQTAEVIAGTYNIHYGYDEPWHISLEAQAKTIEESGADIIALQEVDTGRMTSYAIDNAYYLARRLDMNVVYLPTVEHLTGIALLHRGEAVETDGWWVTSSQEQTGVVYALLMAGDRPIHAYGTWIGLSNEDTLNQMNEALIFIGERSPAVFGGDFNSIPASPVTQAAVNAGFVDPFAQLGITPAPNTSPAINPSKRIDYVWIRGLIPLDAWVPDSLASDHRMVLTKLRNSP